MRPSQSIVIDDEAGHLIGLADTLNRHGMPCHQIRFKGKLDDVVPCHDVRFIFTDLHLASGAITSDHKTDFSMIGSLLEGSIQPRGRYAILLWTKYPDQASNLNQFLRERLHGTPKPVGVSPLPKPNHLTAAGQVRDEGKLFYEIQKAMHNLDVVLDKPERAEIENVLTRLFDDPEVTTHDIVLPGFPSLEAQLDDWLGQELIDYGTTPRAMLESNNPDDLYLLERIVHTIATSRATSHPHVVRDVVRKRIEKLYEQGISLAVIDGPDVSDQSPTSPLEHWMDSPNPLFGVTTPRQFFDAEQVDAQRIQRISARLDAIDDGAFS